MTRRALLIGAQTGGLCGVDEDIRSMERALAGREFIVDRRSGADASRAGILDGLARLARDASTADAVCFYFSGHGAHLPVGTEVLRSIGRPEPRAIQFLVPTDYAESTDRDFRGITSWELSLWLASLTAKTHNVTAIFDCCHAARIMRDGDSEHARPRGLPHPSSTGLAGYLAALKAQGARFDLLDPLGNPHAIRLFASAEAGFAWEGNRDGIWRGAMTGELVRCLERATDRPIPWSTIAVVVRERVRQQFASQRPELAGPGGRAPFSCDEPEGRRALGVNLRDGRAVLQAGGVAGICRGDTFDLVPFTADPEDAAAIAAHATIDTVGPFESTASLEVRRTSERSEELVAYARARALPALAVRCVGDEDTRQLLREAPWLRLTEAEEVHGLVTVELHEESWLVSDRGGPLRMPVPRAHGSGALVEALADLAAAGALRALEGVHGLAPSSIEVSSISPGCDGPRQTSGDVVLSPGDRFTMEIENRSRSPLYLHLFEVAPHGGITRLSSSWPLGLVLAPDAPHVLGGADAGMAGIPARWPEGLPEGPPRKIDLILIVATREIDLGFLERRVHARPRITREAGRARDVRAPSIVGVEQARALGFLVVRRQYTTVLREAVTTSAGPAPPGSAV